VRIIGHASSVSTNVSASAFAVVILPTRTEVIQLTVLAGVVVPALTRIVDLALRARIP
jgi:hypothetical protein